jgi:hypothetical protein
VLALPNLSRAKRAESVACTTGWGRLTTRDLWRSRRWPTGPQAASRQGQPRCTSSAVNAPTRPSAGSQPGLWAVISSMPRSLAMARSPDRALMVTSSFSRRLAVTRSSTAFLVVLGSFLLFCGQQIVGGLGAVSGDGRAHAQGTGAGTCCTPPAPPDPQVLIDTTVTGSLFPGQYSTCFCKTGVTSIVEVARLPRAAHQRMRSLSG